MCKCLLIYANVSAKFASSLEKPFRGWHSALVKEGSFRHYQDWRDYNITALPVKAEF